MEKSDWIGLGTNLGLLVDLSELNELYYITPIANVPSILKRGILCNRLGQQLNPNSVADPTVQAIRAQKRVPGGRPLHNYANLYFCARNPMMFKRRELHLDLCVLRVSSDVLRVDKAVIADGNAASDATAFWPAPAGLAKIDKELVFAQYWTDPDAIRQHHKKRVICAEVLAPKRIDPRYIIGAYVSCEEARQKLRGTSAHLAIEINPYLFFME